MGAAQYIHDPGYHALILRRTYKQLAKAESILNVSKEWWHGKAKWNGDTYTWTFPSGATVEFGHMDGPNDHLNYQGAVFQFVCYDELTQWGDETQYTFLFTRQRRPLGSDLPIRMRATSNPGGPGMEWVKKRFIDPKTRRTDAHFIPARLDDNPNLDRQEYIASMGQVDPITRAQMLEGDWNAVKGGRFLREWFRYYRRDEDYVVLYDENNKEIERFIPERQPRWMTCDPAAGTSDAADHFVLSTFCLSPKANMVWLDCHRARYEIPEQVAVVERLYRRYQPQFIAVEEVLNQRALAQLLRRSTSPPMVVHSVTPLGKKKIERATPAIVFVSTGRLFLPEDNRAFPLEDVEGELIRFASGLVPIKDVPVGEHVWTRDGWKPVIASGMTHPNANVMTIELDNGMFLTGTCAHRVASSINGWRRMDQLKPGDEVLVCPTNESFPKWKSSHPNTASNSQCSMGESTVDTQTVNGETTDFISSATTTGRKPHDCFIETCGNTTMGQSQKATTSTTQTAINSTTPSVTSCVSPSLNTDDWTRNLVPTGEKKLSPISKESVHSLPSGTVAKKDENGTGKTPRSLGRSEAQTNSCVSLAEHNSKPVSAREKPSSASQLVQPNIEENPVLTTKTELAASAENSSGSVDTVRQGLVAANVVACWAGNREKVYNLTVEGCPEYLANGILTHNCDTLFYSVQCMSMVAPYTGMDGSYLKPGYRDPTSVDREAQARRLEKFSHLVPKSVRPKR